MFCVIIQFVRFLHLGGPLAGNKKTYEKALRNGLDLAWGGDWEGALEAYEVALVEMPDDPAVHSHVGLACFELQRYE